MKMRSLTRREFGRDIYVDEQVILANPPEAAAPTRFLPWALAGIAAWLVLKG